MLVFTINSTAGTVNLNNTGATIPAISVSANNIYTVTKKYITAINKYLPASSKINPKNYARFDNYSYFKNVQDYIEGSYNVEMQDNFAEVIENIPT